MEIDKVSFLTCLHTHSRCCVPTTNNCARDGGGPVKPHRSAAFVLSVVSVVIFTQLLLANAQAAGLQSAYSFDSISGSTVPDVSGNGNSLSMLNGAILGTGKYGLAMSFDGVNDVLVANGYNPALNLTNVGFTLSAWINPRSNGSWQMIVNKPYTTGHSAPYFDWSMHRETGTGRIVLYLGCEGVQRVSNATTPINTWTHVAVTYDGSAIRHYINGNLDRTTSASCKVTNTNSRPILIGSNGGNSETMNGLIDDVRIYDRVLSGTEIQTDMATPLGGAGPPDTTPPTVVIATPAYDAIISGTVTMTANAADNIGVAGVQFQVDGQNVMAEDVSAPYSIGWNTTLVSDGSHTLVAVARDAAGNRGSSTPTIVHVRNLSSAPTVSLSAIPTSVASGANATLTWSSTNATGCTASGAWSGNRATSGSASTGPLTAAINTFALTCTGIGGSASATTVVTVSAPGPATRLQSAYSFDSISGSTVPDVSGNGNSLSMLNGAILGTGKYGLAMSFDGVNDVLVANGYNPALNLTNVGFTLSAWINPRSNGSWQMIVNKPYTTGHSAPYFDWSMHRETGTGRIVLYLGCEGVQRVSNATTPINTWTHVAVTYDGSAIRHYINGNLDRTTSASCKVTNTNSRPILIGSNGANSETMNGLIDDVRIYDRVLSGTEIQTDMATPLGGAGPPDTTPPTVVIATPAYDAIISGTVTMTANAADNIGVAGVQFQVDGQNVMAEDVSAPYSIGWNTTLVSDGSHTLVAVARDAAGNRGSSTPTIVHVRNLSSAPTVSLSAIPTSVASGANATLTWSSTNATGCTASGAWSGNRATSGSASTGPLTAAINTFALTCTGIGGSASAYAIVTVNAPTPAPTVTLSASPTSVASGASSNLTWNSLNATSCTASGAWSGNRATAGSASTGPLTAASNTFALTCSGTGGSTSASAIVTVTGAAAQRGLDFEGNASTSGTVRFKFTNPLAIYPATYIWKVFPLQQSGYYTTFFWGNDDGAGNLNTFQWDHGNSNTYYGAHPYPNYPGTTTHRWEIATDHGGDFVSSELVVYDRWYTQALVAWSDSAGKHTVFYWDLPDTSKRVEHVADPSYGNTNPPAPTLTWGDAPWNPSNEIMNGVIRGIQIYSIALSVNDVLAELSAPQSTSAGASNIWYMNLDPTPSDITDKSGRGHHPTWVGSGRPLIWTGQ